MEQLNLFTENEVQHGQRLAASPLRNSARVAATKRVKPEERRRQAVAQANVSSPETGNIPEAEMFGCMEGSMIAGDKRRAGNRPAGSKAMAWRHKDSSGTRETHFVPRGIRAVCGNKSINDKDSQKARWESDSLIVPMKAWKHAGGKGRTVMRRSERDTVPVHRDGIGQSTKLSLLNQRAAGNRKEKYTSLMHLMTVEFLAECFGMLKKSACPGIDGVTVEEYGKRLTPNLEKLVERLKRKQYRSMPVKRVYIDKGKGKLRPLGLPALEDKIVQKGITRILQAIHEPIFLPVSNGFRPGRSCHTALNALDKILMSREVNCVVDMDIAQFFDTVNHGWIMKFLKERIGDPNMLRLIGRFLRTGIMEEGKVRHPETGTPQGGVLSPLLANIYLHYALDLWFEKVVKKHVKGYSAMIRYADDAIECFASEHEAARFLRALEGRLAKFGLSLSKEKTKTVKFGRKAWKEWKETGKRAGTFNFLGFTHFCDTTRKGKYKVGRRTAKERYNSKTKTLNEWLKEVRNTQAIEGWWPTLCAKLRGHYQYYGVSGNMRMLEKYYDKAVKLAYKWTNRRSQRKSYNWQQFTNRLRYNPLPQPRIAHNLYTLHPSS